MAYFIKYLIRLILPVLLIAVLLPSNAKPMVERQEKYGIKLLFTDATIDKDNNLYAIVNTWTTRGKNLVRILPDHSIDRKFRLARMNSCCTVDPFAVDTDGHGNIYILTYQDWITDFALAKYGPDGELDEDYAEEGVLKYAFDTPVDLCVSPNGVAYILDTGTPEVYAVAPDGSEVLGFVYKNYSLIKPSKLELGLNQEIYIFDQFDLDFTRYEISQGIVGLYADGTPMDDFGAYWGEINSGADPLNYASFVVDADGSLWVLGPYGGGGPLSGAYHFDPNGLRIGATSLQYRHADVDQAVGIIADNESGFIIFEIQNISLVVMRYKPDGTLREKFSAEVFKRPFE
jgi:hypothetical protein